jgi:hypothetical protein
MVSGFESIGDAVTGGMAARAVEPAAGEAGAHREKNCLNCGAALVGDFCHRCGQRGHVHRTLGAFWHDLLHAVLHFEGKLGRTLPMLVWRPGELTRRYIEGQRARFVSPIAMFLFSVFLMFAVFSSLGGVAYKDRSASKSSAPVEEELVSSRPQTARELEQQARAEREENLGEIEALKRARARLVSMGKDPTRLDGDLRQIQAELALEERLLQQALELQRAEDGRTARHKQPLEGVWIHPQKGPALFGFNEAYQKAKRNRSLLTYKVQTNAYKYSWALIPIMVPFVWLLFLNRRRYGQYKLYDHTVFVTYSLTFLSMAAILLTFLKLLGLSGPAALLPLLIPLMHLFRQLRGAYQLSVWSALWRTVALAVLACVAAALFFLMLLALGVLS